MRKQQSSTDIPASVREHARLVEAIKKRSNEVASVGKAVVDVLRNGGKLLTAGNGGSAVEALHMAEELVGRFRSNRRSLPAIPLAADGTVLTCIGNDFGFDAVFSRQVEGLGNPGDMLVLFSTSGKARNLSLAIKAARAKHLQIVCFLGRDGGNLAGKADCEIIVPGDDTARIQEVHLLLVHLVLQIVEENFSAL